MAMTFIKHFIKEIHTKTGGSCKYVLFTNSNFKCQYRLLKKIVVNKEDLLMEGYNHNECWL